MEPLENGDYEAFEDRHVHQVYTAIADDFSKTRYKVWPSVQKFINMITPAPASSVLEVGCGNGKNLFALRDRGITDLTGCDASEQFVQMVCDAGITCVKANAVALPFASGAFDWVLSVAVIHHLSTEDRRVLAIRELIRVAKKDGLIFIQVWAFEQQPGSKRSFTKQDSLVSWNTTRQTETETYLRFYHLFVENELETLIKTHFDGIVTIEDHQYDYGNWLVVLHKT